MAVQKDSRIKAYELIDYLSTKDHIQIARHDVGNSFGGEDKTWEDKFWNRSDPTVFDAPTWDSGVTYAINVLVESGIYTWRSLQNGNINNSPAENSYWTQIATRDSTTTQWTNFTVHLWNWGSTYQEYWLYKWNEATDAWVETHHGIFGDSNQNIYVKLSIVPGRYKLKMRISTPGLWLGNGAISGKAKQWDISYEPDDQIRVMRDDYFELKTKFTTLLTADRAKDGKFSHVDYLGGTEEGD